MRYKSLQDNWSSNGLLTASETSYKGLEDLAQNNQLQQITLLINFQKYWWWLNKQGNHNANLAWKCKFGQCANVGYSGHEDNSLIIFLLKFTTLVTRHLHSKYQTNIHFWGLIFMWRTKQRQIWMQTPTLLLGAKVKQNLGKLDINSTFTPPLQKSKLSPFHFWTKFAARTNE